ncbi:6-phosphofructokinase 1 [Nematocida sp. LUAm3]|nr:6-phosphofructokinase 1 [Nematocida sp. LUAm3]KAI5175516.1 6-phosphofructokinase 1 [Nematocida sp. LUAm2]KAI5178454.1 6-phosphofructokinase 1 [Nematocida sp. LUAm1]
MVKIEFFFKTREKRDAVIEFYESLGLSSTTQGRYLKLKSTQQTRIVSVTQTRISLRAQNHKDILENHKDFLLDLETDSLEEDVELDHAYKEHQIPFKIKLTDPLKNRVCITPALEPKIIGVLTSGGDAPGMNSVIWSIVKAAARNGVKVLGIHNGFSGLLTGEIEEIYEETAYQNMHLGGTFLKSARCKEFLSAEGRRKAIENLKSNSIDALIVIGGDGSMKGAGKLAEEFPELSVVFIPGSIDNDIPGTDSLGAATAMHRIIEAIDCIECTMVSHRRGFVLEVMGRDCGWLALASAVSTDASYVVLPEYPLEPNWKADLQRRLSSGCSSCTYVILSEGAKYSTGERVSASHIKDAMEEIGIETRTSVLGHTQRGGAPCAADRLIAPTLGVAATEVALSRQGAYAVYINNTTEKVLDLFDAIERAEKASSSLKAPTEKVIRAIRGKEFIEMYRALMHIEETPKHKEVFLVTTVGALGAGAENIIKNLEKYSKMYNKEIHSISKHQYFHKRNSRGKPTDQDFLSLQEHISSFSPSALVLIGGLDAVAEAKRLSSFIERIYVIPCTVSNNVPGTFVSVGAETALDTITALCDNLKMNSTKGISYLVEVFGSACGYLSISAALGVGAIDCYFPEETCILKKLARSVKSLNRYFSKSGTPQLIIRGNGAMKGVCNETVAKILETDGNGKFVVRHCALGHAQKGNRATAMDRLRAAKLSLYALKATKQGAYIIGLKQGAVGTTALSDALEEINHEKRRMKRASWLEMARTYRVLN